MSSGAFAALNLALRHTDQVGIALALEPYGDPGNVTRRLLRGDVSLLHANSPQYYLARMPLQRLLHVYLDVGSATGEVGRVTSLERLLHARGESVLHGLRCRPPRRPCARAVLPGERLPDDAPGPLLAPAGG